MRTREAELLRTIADMSYAVMGMYQYQDHESLASHIVFEVADQLGIPQGFLESTPDSDIPYMASFHVRIGKHAILVHRVFMAQNNREAMLKSRNISALLFPGSPRVDDNGVYFFDGGEVAVRLEKLVSLNPFDLSVEESLLEREAA